MVDYIVSISASSLVRTITLNIIMHSISLTARTSVVWQDRMVNSTMDMINPGPGNKCKSYLVKHGNRHCPISSLACSLCSVYFMYMLSTQPAYIILSTFFLVQLLILNPDTPVLHIL